MVTRSACCFITCFLILSLLTACAPSDGTLEEESPAQESRPETTQEVIGVEEIGGKYNLSLDIVEVRMGERSGVMKMIRYEKDGETVEPDMMLPDNMRPGLGWMKENLTEDAIVMSWWDYGHMIRAYAEREPVLDAPSREILTKTVAKYLGKSPEEVECDACADHSNIQDVARILLSEDAGQALAVMQSYGATALYIHRDDRMKSMAFYIALSEEPAEPDSEEFSRTLIGRALEEEPIPGLELVYSDSVCRVYIMS